MLCKYLGMYTLLLSCHVIAALPMRAFLKFIMATKCIIFFTVPSHVPFQCPSFCELQHCHVRAVSDELTHGHTSNLLYFDMKRILLL
uniref:Integrin beta like 1 n=1 Tax=Rhipicephalus appendiculatus TaxID=34631 RepID=A0A131YFP9_RHIAP